MDAAQVPQQTLEKSHNIGEDSQHTQNTVEASSHVAPEALSRGTRNILGPSSCHLCLPKSLDRKDGIGSWNLAEKACRSNSKPTCVLRKANSSKIHPNCTLEEQLQCNLTANSK
jgi:hypothetical protein